MARNTANKQPQPTPAAMPAEPTQRAAQAPRPGPSHEQIARRAYEIFLARSGMHGSSEQDWLQAERELRLGRQ